MTGAPFFVDVPKNATFQTVMDAARPTLQQRYSKFAKVKQIFQEGRVLDPKRRLNEYGSFNPQRWLGLMVEDPSATVRYYMNDPERRLKAAQYRNRVNRRETLRAARRVLPDNVLNYQIAPMLGVPANVANPRQLNGGKRRKSRKSKKSRKTSTRRR